MLICTVTVMYVAVT